MSQNVTKCHTFSNLWYKATFTFYVWIRLGTALCVPAPNGSSCLRVARIFSAVPRVGGFSGTPADRIGASLKRWGMNFNVIGKDQDR